MRYEIERELHSLTDLLRQNQESTSNKALNTNKLWEICQICYKERHLASNCRKLTNFGRDSNLQDTALTNVEFATLKHDNR